MLSPDAPGPSSVPRNRWDLVAPGELFTSGISVSIIVSSAAPVAESFLQSLLSGRCAGCDVELLLPTGSRTPVPAAESDEVKFTRLDRLPSGDLGAYRNAAAERALHDVLLFVDADSDPAPGWLDAHLRWHVVASDLVVIGRTLAADEQQPAWVVGHRLRTRSLTADQSDLFRFFPSANVSLRRGTLVDAGGFSLGDTSNSREDEALGFRLHQLGAILVPAEAAVCRLPLDRWPERRPQLRPAEAASLAQRVAHPAVRRPVDGRSYGLSLWDVLVDGSGTTTSDLAASIESVLGSRTHDVVVRLTSLSEPEVADWARESFRSDPRVQFDGMADPWTPLRLELPAGTVVGRGTLDALQEAFDDPEDAAGVLRVTLPGRPPGDAAAVAVTARALHRGARMSPEDPASAAADLCGQRWLSGSTIELRWRESEAAPNDVSLDAGAAGLDLDQFRDLWGAMASLSEGERRVVLGVGQRLLGSPTWFRGILVRMGRLFVRA